MSFAGEERVEIATQEELARIARAAEGRRALHPRDHRGERDDPERRVRRIRGFFECPAVAAPKAMLSVLRQELVVPCARRHARICPNCCRMLENLRRGTGPELTAADA